MLKTFASIHGPDGEGDQSLYATGVGGVVHLDDTDGCAAGRYAVDLERVPRHAQDYAVSGHLAGSFVVPVQQ